MLKISCLTHGATRYVLSGVLAVCASATCAAATTTTLSGTPATSVTVGSTYSFQPGIKDSKGYSIEWFAIKNKPAWATFNATTGLLTGKPTSAQVGTYSNIGIYGSDGREYASMSTFSITVKAAGSTTSGSSTTTLSGTPATSVTVGSTYSFQPGIKDSKGYSIEWFAIKNKPAWATFNATTGLLTGKPTSAQVGTYGNISIYGSDGHEYASMSTFSIAVKAATTTSGTGTATLAWTAPTKNTNGSALTNLAGYRVHYGKSASALSTVVQVPGAGVRTYTLKNLGAATYYFAITAYTNTGVESALSKVVSKAVN